MDEGLKQRIIGAVVLIIAAVVFLPMLLSGQDETVQVEVEVPEAPVLDSQLMEPVAPAALPEPAAVPEMPASLSEAPPDVPAPAVAESAPAPAVEPEPEAEQPAPAAVTATGDWVIQLGSFSSAANAEGLSKDLRTQGYNAYTHSATVQGKPITRVYVGPLASREAANRLRDELERKRGSKGFVVAFDADSGRD
ncbi:cell division protein [Halopseudomonas oceani]|uniref:Cell division protein n=1 Tax=Halopseudomonas oceani TaxID=1708783 RepID=A0A2P4EWU7_9GAMM|nr:SPOR domain-containing protein [Halopseudomonas oceani]POB04460.1 cell division protein [Halopseudomonas oceani]GGE40051.1 cell division protein [Halopseudomonas oceani]